MKKIVVILVMVGMINVVLAEGPPVEWEKNFGGGDDDYGYSVQHTIDGGYIITGHTKSYGAGNWDVWLIKTDPNGKEVWNNTFGGSNIDESMSVEQTSDGGYIVAGYTESFGAGGLDVWLIKTDLNGNDIWDKTFGGSSEDIGISVRQTSEGGYIIAARTTSYGEGEYDVWLIKTDADGNDIWDKTFGGSSRDIPRSAQQTSDGGYIIAGYTESYGAGSFDVWLIKTDSDGNKIWDKTFGGSNSDHGFSVQQTLDGYIIVGDTKSYGVGSLDVWLIKTDTNGNEIWRKTFGGSSGESARFVQQTFDGGYIIAGYTESYGAGSFDVWLIKTDSDGNDIWNKTFGGGDYDYGNSAQQTTDGGYIIVGNTLSYGTGDFNVYLIKLSADCINQPRSDLTGDCKTDYRDFAIMAYEWLDCGQYDPNDCL